MSFGEPCQRPRSQQGAMVTRGQSRALRKTGEGEVGGRRSSPREAGVGATARCHWGSGIWRRRPPNLRSSAWWDPFRIVRIGGSWGPESRGRMIAGAKLGSEGTRAPEIRWSLAPAAAATGPPPGATSPGPAAGLRAAPGVRDPPRGQEPEAAPTRSGTRHRPKPRP